MHLTADNQRRLLGEHDVHGIRVGRDVDRHVRLLAAAGIGGRLVQVADMVAVDMAEEHGVDLAQPRIAAAAHRASDVVKDPGAVRILENYRPVERTELAVMTAERRDFHVLRCSRQRRHQE